MKRQRVTAVRAVSPGLALVEPVSRNTLIAYAAKERTTASDGDGKHSPFAMALLKNLTVPGLDLRIVASPCTTATATSTGRS